MFTCRNLWPIAVVAVFSAFVVWSCAKVGAPPGGPEDKTPPTVVENYPKSDAVKVARHMVARLVFSKPVNRRSVEAALFLSPEPYQRLRYHWKRNTLELIYLDPLDTNRTYVISVGSQARDLHGNPLGSTYTIAFSTGSLIDRGRIQGWVDEKDNVQAVALWAYQLTDADTLVNPAHRTAEYRLQPNKDGTFFFNYVKAGRYRVFAVTDRNHDGFWNPPAERIGVPPWDVMVSDSALPWLSFRLTEQDTQSVTLRSVRQVDNHWLQIRTSRTVDSLTAHFVKNAGDTIASMAAYADTSGADLWNVFPQQPLTSGLWTASAQGRDEFGKVWSASDTMTVREKADTVSPRLLRTIPRARAKTTQLPAAAIAEFDEPVSTDSLSSLFTVVADTDTVACHVQQLDPRTFSAQVIPSFAEGKRYRFDMNSYLLQDASGNHPADSTLSFSFTTLPLDSLGSIVGNLSGPPGAYLLSVWTLRDHTLAGTERLKAPGSFTIERLTIGKYLLQVVRDVNGDGKLTYGSVVPLEYSEPFRFSPDTVSVRARWEYETNIVWENTP